MSKKKQSPALITETKNLTKDRKLLIINQFLLSGDRQVTAKKCLVTAQVVDDVIVEYYHVLKDIIDDEALGLKIRENYDKMIQNAININMKALELYLSQIEKIAKLYPDDNPKLIPDFLCRQIGIMLEYTTRLISNQLQLAQQNKVALTRYYTDQRRIELMQDNTDENGDFNENVAFITDFVNKDLDPVKHMDKESEKYKRKYTPGFQTKKTIRVTYLNEHDENGNPIVKEYDGVENTAKILGLSRSTISRLANQPNGATEATGRFHIQALGFTDKDGNPVPPKVYDDKG